MYCCINNNESKAIKLVIPEIERVIIKSDNKKFNSIITAIKSCKYEKQIIPDNDLVRKVQITVSAKESPMSIKRYINKQKGIFQKLGFGKVSEKTYAHLT